MTLDQLKEIKVLLEAVEAKMASKHFLTALRSTGGLGNVAANTIVKLMEENARLRAAQPTDDQLDRIESYGFECVAGPLANCQDWLNLRRLAK